jgi:heme-degrading monooxygenase HmoA
MMKLLTFVLLPFLLLGCKVSTPFADASHDGSLPDNTDVLVAITYIEIGDDAMQNKAFWRQVASVEAALEGMPGFLGYSLRRELFGNKAWTMTVWRDEASLMAFVAGPVHQAAIVGGSPSLRTARFARLEAKKADMPIDWGVAEKYLAENGRGY